MSVSVNSQMQRVSDLLVGAGATEDEVKALLINLAERSKSGYIQWATDDNQIFCPCSNTCNELVPGIYEAHSSDRRGFYFERIPIKTENLLHLPNTTSDNVIEEIIKFWEREEVFRRYKLAYKRGILLYGPQGTGKSCTIQLVMEDVVNRGGIVLKYTNIRLVIRGLRILRQIQPTTPLVVLMEDIDSIIEEDSESDVLQLLDGVDSIDKAVFLATTNYPERLGKRVINRPSRFDKRIEVGPLTRENRRLYFEFLLKNGEQTADDANIDMDRWVDDTDNMSIAHLKELFSAVIILGDTYPEALEVLKSMSSVELDSEDFEKNSKPAVGFGRGRVPKMVRPALDYEDDEDDW